MSLSENSSENHSWFALRIKARLEKLVAASLRSKGYEEFLPLYHCRRHWSDRIKTQELPLFPGYVFCRFDVHNRLPILLTPGVLLIVGCGRTPLPVEHSEIAALQSIVNSRLKTEPWPYLRIGQRVRIEEGSLEGTEGILLATKPRRLVVSVTILQRSVSVEIEETWARPIPSLSAFHNLWKAGSLAQKTVSSQSGARLEGHGASDSGRSVPATPQGILYRTARPPL